MTNSTPVAEQPHQGEVKAVPQMIDEETEETEETEEDEAQAATPTEADNTAREDLHRYMVRATVQKIDEVIRENKDMELFEKLLPTLEGCVEMVLQDDKKNDGDNAEEDTTDDKEQLMTQLLYDPLMTAVEKGHVEVVRILLDHGGVHVNVGHDENGVDTPLCMAAYKFPILSKKDDDDDDSKDIDNDESSHKAKDLAMVEYLIARGAMVNARGAEQRTALHYAVLGGHLDICQSLLKHGTNPFLQNEEGDDPLDVANEMGDRPDIVMVLGRIMMNIEKFRQAAQENDVEQIREILDDAGQDDGLNDGITINVDTPVDENGSTTLHNTAQLGHLSTTEFLLGQGATVGARNAVNATPLHCAALTNQCDTARYLLEVGGADMDVMNFVDETPLHIAAHLGHVAMAELLLDHRANLEAVSLPNGGLTPLLYAARNAQFDMVKCLVSQGANIMARDTHLEHQRTAAGWASYLRDLLGQQDTADNSTDETQQHLGEIEDYLRALT